VHEGKAADKITAERRGGNTQKKKVIRFLRNPCLEEANRIREENIYPNQERWGEKKKSKRDMAQESYRV